MEEKGTVERPITLLSACIHFFGLRQGQKRMDFGKDEYIKIPQEGKEELAEGLRKQGYSIERQSIHIKP